MAKGFLGFGASIVVVCIGLVGCSERIGEPIVAASTDGSADANDTGYRPPDDGFEPYTDGSDGSVSLSSDGGLCAPCESHRDCGEYGDACLTNDVTMEQFCGRDCLERGGCPDGFACFSVGGSSSIINCAPVSGSCTGNPSTTSVFASASLIEMRAYVVDRLNMARAERQLPALIDDGCLDAEGQASAVELADTVLSATVTNGICDAATQECACAWQSDTNSVALASGDWRSSIDAAIATALTQNADDSVFSASFGRIGVGIVVGELMFWQAWKFGI